MVETPSEQIKGYWIFNDLQLPWNLTQTIADFGGYIWNM